VARTWNRLLVILALSASGQAVGAGDGGMLIDDFSAEVSALGTRWRLVSDRVMGGVSDGTLSRETVAGRRALCMRGLVSLENNGGFLQLALDLHPSGSLDAAAYEGVRLLVRGNNERYSLHLKSADVRMPWQSYRQEFEAGARWRPVRLPFGDFQPHRIDTPLDTGRLRRLGLVAIGRRFGVDLCVAELSLY
jgi:hypothetical protein